METIIRVSLKFVGALLLIVALLAACMAAGWAILQTTKPTDTILYLIGMSAFSGLLIAGLTVYRLITMLRSAVLTLLLTAPMLISLMSGVIIYWKVIEAVTVREAPWSEPIFEVMQQFLDFLDGMFG